MMMGWQTPQWEGLQPLDLFRSYKQFVVIDFYDDGSWFGSMLEKHWKDKKLLLLWYYMFSTLEIHDYASYSI